MLLISPLTDENFATCPRFSPGHGFPAAPTPKATFKSAPFLYLSGGTAISSGEAA